MKYKLRESKAFKFLVPFYVPNSYNTAWHIRVLIKYVLKCLVPNSQSLCIQGPERKV